MPTKGNGVFHIYGSKGVFSIQSKVWRDSAFPFDDKEDVTVIVSKDVVTIKKKDHSDQTTL